MDAPRWDLGNVFPGLGSAELAAAIDELDQKLLGLERYLATKVDRARGTSKDLTAVVRGLILRLNDVTTREGTIRAYVTSNTRTDTFDVAARKLESELDLRQVRLRTAGTRVTRFLGRISGRLSRVVAADKSARSHAFFLTTAASQARYLMGDGEETLAAELAPSGGEAWAKLQRVVTSQLAVDFELEGTVRKLPMPELINLRSHRDEGIRHRAWEAEIAAWETVKEPLAAALNGIKAEATTLWKRRGRSDCLHASIDMARIDRSTLEAMLAAMRDSFPIFRRYLKAKAGKLGKDRLAWWDLFAPFGRDQRTLTFAEARTFILSRFETFAPELASLARRAFDERWIDGQMRRGKVGGAFCMEVPGVRESRILCNYDGTLDQVSTLAHELGHAFHNECAFAAGKTSLQRDTPMTLAETASILCETIVNEALLESIGSRDEELSVREGMLSGSTQVIVDIYSRYLFEKEVFERCGTSAVGADELCQIMERAQAETYGDGLDERYRHPFMWTWKPHYYMPEIAFYNYPYAFGLLLGLGLYAIYRVRGKAFVTDYRAFLASTGEASAADLAARFGIDIRGRAFWDAGIEVISRQVERYCEL
jgi:pepF/M3 family oligoendopeptidase